MCLKLQYVFLLTLTISMYKHIFNEVEDLHSEFTKWESSQTEEPEGSKLEVCLASPAWKLRIFIQLLKEDYSISLPANKMWFNGIMPLLESLTAESERCFPTKLKPCFTGVSQYYSKMQKVLLLHSRKIQMLLENNVRYVRSREKSTNMNVSYVSKEGKRLQ